MDGDSNSVPALYTCQRVMATPSLRHVHDKAQGSSVSGLCKCLSKQGRDSLEGQDRHLGEVKKISVPHLKLIQPPWAVKDKIKELCQCWP